MRTFVVELAVEDTGGLSLDCTDAARLEAIEIDLESEKGVGPGVFCVRDSAWSRVTKTRQITRNHNKPCLRTLRSP